MEYDLHLTANLLLIVILHFQFTLKELWKWKISNIFFKFKQLLKTYRYKDKKDITADSY